MIDPRTLSPLDFKHAAARLRGGALAQFMDSTLLHPAATGSQVDNLVDEALRYGFHICVSQRRLTRVKERLTEHKGTYPRHIRSVSVVGFPMGSCSTNIKTTEAAELLAAGVHEIDMVANTGLLKDGSRSCWRDDIQAVAAVISEFNSGNNCRRGLKVIIETCYLTDEEKEFAAGTIAGIGAQTNVPIFVKTSTGLAPVREGHRNGATIEDLVLIRRTLGDYVPGSNPVGVKASGGIRDATTAVKMLIAAGGFDDNLKPVENTFEAARIGTSSAGTIMLDFEEIYGGGSWLYP